MIGGACARGPATVDLTACRVRGSWQHGAPTMRSICQSLRSRAPCAPDRDAPRRAPRATLAGRRLRWAGWTRTSSVARWQSLGKRPSGVRSVERPGAVSRTN